jgi:hypothetical protein
MFNYFSRKRHVLYIITMLEIKDEWNRMPTLCFEYTLKDDILTIVLPSKDSYLFSNLPEKLTIVYEKYKGRVTFSTDEYDLMNTGSRRTLLKHLDKCFDSLTEREKFIHSILECRKRMSSLVDPRHRSNKSHSNKQDGSVYRDILYASDDSSSDDSSSSSSHDNHSSHRDDN